MVRENQAEGLMDWEKPWRSCERDCDASKIRVRVLGEEMDLLVKIWGKCCLFLPTKRAAHGLQAQPQSPAAVWDWVAALLLDKAENWKWGNIPARWCLNGQVSGVGLWAEGSHWAAGVPQQPEVAQGRGKVPWQSSEHPLPPGSLSWLGLEDEEKAAAHPRAVQRPWPGTLSTELR